MGAAESKQVTDRLFAAYEEGKTENILEDNQVRSFPKVLLPTHKSLVRPVFIEFMGERSSWR